MELATSILSEITVYMKYARYLPELNRRETWEELVTRNMNMHIKKYPNLTEEIKDTYKFVLDKKVLPSMRSMQFAGKPVEISPNRVYNCAYAPIDDWRVFGEVMFLLLGGTGVGYSVQKHHVEQLPEIRKPNKERARRFLIADSIEGWAEAVRVLVKTYFFGGSRINFDFSDIRPKGARLITSGGKAPGPQPLRECLVKVEGILDNKKDGEKLTSLEVHDIVCHIADAVLAGGIRRAALISLFSADDEEMIACKSGTWWENNPQRGRANNSALLLRHKVTKEFFLDLWKRVEASGAGEPGIIFSNDKDWGTNPSLRKGTKVYTTEGIVPIEELQDKNFTVKNINGELSPAKCWLSGRNKQLYKLTLEGNKEYYATPEHEWPIWDGEKFVKVKTSDLKPDTYLPTIKELSLFEGNKGTYDEGFLAGWNIGDGWIVQRDDRNDSIGFIFSKTDVTYDIHSKIFKLIEEKTGSKIKGTTDRQGCLEYTSNSKYLNNLFKDIGLVSKENGLPSIVWKDGTEEFRKGLIDGLYSSDGGIENPSYGRAINYYTVHKKLAEDLSELLGFYGIKSSTRSQTADKVAFGKEYKDHTSYVVSITDRGSIIHFNKLFTLSHEEKQNKINKFIEKFEESRYAQARTSDFIRIKEIELTDIYEDVWDISVQDETHCFQISHCITGNCAEIALRPYQFCNLTEVNVSDVDSQEEYEARVKAASFIGTLQAGYTDFHYLRPIWQRTTEKDALIGVSMTGIGSGAVLNLNMKAAARVVKEENERVAGLIGINKAARTTTVKPAGTTSLTLGTSSGIHAWHNDYYLRRIRVGKNEAIYTYLLINHPELIEDEFFRPHDTAVISVPQKAPNNAIMRTESPFQLLERVKRVYLDWIKYGHRTGNNTHNVSATVSIRSHEWASVGEWMWENRDNYTGLSVLPFSEHTYKQAPFEDCTKEEYERLMKSLHGIDLSKVVELADNTDLAGELACANGACEVV